MDSVGSTTLANVLSQTSYGGADLPGAVLPHILRGVALIGVDSVMAPHAKRARAWQTLAQSLDTDHLAQMTRPEPMSALPALAEDILAGKIRGRVVVNVNA